MSWISDFFHPAKPYKAAEDAFNQKYQEGQGYLNPYNQQGQQAGQQLQDQYGQLQNPDELYNKWAQGYQESPYAHQQQQFANDAGLNSAASQGLLGSSSALQNIQNTSAGIVNQDQQQYMNDLMNKYLAGIGIGQNLYNQGAGAAGQQAGNAQNAGQYGSQLAYGRQGAGADLFGKGLGALGGLGLNYFTGGFGQGGFGRGAFQPSSDWLRGQGGR